MIEKRFEIRSIECAFRDQRGEIFNILEDLVIKHVARYTSNEGALRGNHYHPEGIEAIFLESGRCALYLKDPDDSTSSMACHIVIPQHQIAIYDARYAHAMKYMEP